MLCRCLLKYINYCRTATAAKEKSLLMLLQKRIHSNFLTVCERESRLLSIHVRHLLSPPRSTAVSLCLPKGEKKKSILEDGEKHALVTRLHLVIIQLCHLSFAVCAICMILLHALFNSSLPINCLQ